MQNISISQTAVDTIAAVNLAAISNKKEGLLQNPNSQLKNCVADLKSIRLPRHPSRSDVDYHKYQIDENLRLWIASNPRVCVEWSGEGVYGVRASGHVLAGYYRVRQWWCDIEKRHDLYGSFYFAGWFINPTEKIEPWQLVRKLEDGELWEAAVHAKCNV